MYYFTDPSKRTGPERIADKVYQICRNSQLKLNGILHSVGDFAEAIGYSRFGSESRELCGAMQLSFQYAMLKAAVTATGANGVCTRQAAKFIDQALIEGIDSPAFS